MSKYARSIRIGAIPAAVWAAIVDVATWPTWASQFKRLVEPCALAADAMSQINPGWRWCL